MAAMAGGACARPYQVLAQDRQILTFVSGASGGKEGGSGDGDRSDRDARRRLAELVISGAVSIDVVRQRGSDCVIVPADRAKAAMKAVPRLQSVQESMAVLTFPAAPGAAGSAAVARVGMAVASAGTSGLLMAPPASETATMMFRSDVLAKVVPALSAAGYVESSPCAGAKGASTFGGSWGGWGVAFGLGGAGHEEVPAKDADRGGNAEAWWRFAKEGDGRERQLVVNVSVPGGAHATVSVPAPRGASSWATQAEGALKRLGGVDRSPDAGAWCRATGAGGAKETNFLALRLLAVVRQKKATAIRQHGVWIFVGKVFVKAVGPALEQPSGDGSIESAAREIVHPGAVQREVVLGHVDGSGKLRAMCLTTQADGHSGPCDVGGEIEVHTADGVIVHTLPCGTAEHWQVLGQRGGSPFSAAAVSRGEASKAAAEKEASMVLSAAEAAWEKAALAASAKHPIASQQHHEAWRASGPPEQANKEKAGGQTGKTQRSSSSSSSGDRKAKEKAGKKKASSSGSPRRKKGGRRSRSRDAKRSRSRGADKRKARSRSRSRSRSRKRPAKSSSRDRARARSRSNNRSSGRKEEGDKALARALARRSRSRSGVKKKNNLFDQKAPAVSLVSLGAVVPASAPQPAVAALAVPSQQSLVAMGTSVAQAMAQVQVAVPLPSADPEVEAFLALNPLEAGTAARFRVLPLNLQKMVIMRGSLVGTRDPSAVLMSRVRDVIQHGSAVSSAMPGMMPGMGMGMAMGGPMPGAGAPTQSSPEVEAFLSVNSVDFQAACRLRALPPHLQRQVVARGSLSGARDQSSVLMSRVRDAMASSVPMPGMGCAGGGAANFRAGDWACARCGYHNFGSKAACSQCGAQAPMLSGGQASGGFSV